MTDRERIIAALEHCATDEPCIGEKFRSCTYRAQYHENCMMMITRDVLELLKAQEPKVTCRLCKHSRFLSGTWFCFKIGSNGYGKSVADGEWYCKDAESRPTDEQRREVAWRDD